jgi:DegV family protein with EDD domain
MTVKIVTDTASDIPQQVAQEMGIIVVPLHLRFGTEVYHDGVNLTTAEFYRKLISSRKLPTTSAPSPGEMAEVYDKLSAETSEILSIHTSSKFSAIYEAALRAKEQMKKKCQVEVIDSMSGIMGDGLIVIAAAETAKTGIGLDQIVDMVRKDIPKAHVRMCFDTLEYLRRGGRIGRAQALLGTLLKVHPILGIKDGEAHPFGRERSRTKAIERLYEFAKSFTNIKGLAVEYATTPDEATALAQRLNSVFPEKHIYISAVSPVVGTHVGPRALAVSLLEG